MVLFLQNALVNLCFSGKKTKAEVKKISVMRLVYSHTQGTKDFRTVEQAFDRR